jgi:predicted DNA-binding protein with PD1-like motif
MQTWLEGEVLVIKLDQGEELYPSMAKAMESRGMRSGLVVGGIGAIRDFELGYYDLRARRYLRRRYRSDHELLGMRGSASLGADPPFHIHCSVGRRDMTTRGGHLFGATVAAAAEVYILGLRGATFGRAYNPATGLRELSFGP